MGVATRAFVFHDKGSTVPDNKNGAIRSSLALYHPGFKAEQGESPEGATDTASKLKLRGGGADAADSSFSMFSGSKTTPKKAGSGFKPKAPAVPPPLASRRLFSITNAGAAADTSYSSLPHTAPAATAGAAAALRPPVSERVLVAFTSCNNASLIERVLATSPRDLPWVDYAVVDDASTVDIAGVVAAASAHLGGVRLVRSDAPRGLTALWNAMWRIFVDEGYEALIISNNDVRIPIGALEAMRDAMRSDPSVHVWGPLTTTKGLGRRRINVTITTAAAAAGNTAAAAAAAAGATAGVAPQLPNGTVSVVEEHYYVTQELSSVHPYLPRRFLQPYVPIGDTQTVQDALTQAVQGSAPRATTASASSLVAAPAPPMLQPRPKRYLLGFFLAFSRSAIPKAQSLQPSGGDLIPDTPNFVVINQVRVLPTCVRSSFICMRACMRACVRVYDCSCAHSGLVEGIAECTPLMLCLRAFFFRIVVTGELPAQEQLQHGRGNSRIRVPRQGLNGAGCAACRRSQFTVPVPP